MKRWIRSDKSTKLKWSDDDLLQVGNASFLLAGDPKIWDATESGDRFVLLKSKEMVESLPRFAPNRVENIVDLGIFKGGSIALYQELFSPKRLVGIDKRHDRVDALDRLIAQHSLSDVVRLYYGTDQADQETLERIVRDNFGDAPLDLVVDDCSHMYEPTKASLNVLLPRLCPGGLYVIEDWGWAHWSGDFWQGSDHPFNGEQTALTKLIFELVMVVASRPGLISEVTVASAAAYLTRGTEVVSARGFDISENYLTAGRQILCEHTTSG